MVETASKNLQLRGEIIRGLQESLIHGGHSIAMIPKSIATIIDKDMWREWIDPTTGEVHEYETFDRFAAAPRPDGLNAKRQELLDLCHGHKDAQRKIKRVWSVEELAQAPGRPAKSNVRNTNINSSTDDANYAERRLRRDRKDLYDRVQGGELSPHAAMVEAGFRKKTITIPSDLDAAARRLVRHFDPDELYGAMIEARL